MNIFPAIDLKDGQCVRLTQGDFNQQKMYDRDPIAIAKHYEKEGAQYLHVVDLDGAKEGSPINVDVIKRIRDAVSLFIQVGGGIRTLETAQMYLSMGMNRIIIGTSAIEDEPFLSTLIKQDADRIAVGLDVEGDEVMIKGWVENSKISLSDTLKRLEDLGVCTIICTDIKKDGMLQGTNLELYHKLKTQTTMKIIASGGVTSIDELMALRRLSLDGVIIGKALYEKRLTLKEVLGC